MVKLPLFLSLEPGLRGKDGNFSTVKQVPLSLSLEPGQRGKDGKFSTKVSFVVPALA